MKDIESLGLRVQNGLIEILDQTQLPTKEVWIKSESPEKMIQIIQNLSVRGAPLIGVSAALQLAHFKENGASETEYMIQTENLRKARPTAVNLMWAMDRMKENYNNAARCAYEIFFEDVELCNNMALHGEPLIQDGDNILTHCNTGGLATAGVGTALGVIRRAHENGKKIHVYVDETRPLLQGGRLTTWELSKLGIPYTLICDNMAGFLMAQGKINKAFVGSDRIATNGDFANKIGTYSVAVLCKHHEIPFYPVAPYTTIDFEAKSGKDIPIEERISEEVRGVSPLMGQLQWAPKDSKTYNPAFDVTPVELVTGIVLDSGYVSQANLKEGRIKKGQSVCGQ